MNIAQTMPIVNRAIVNTSTFFMLIHFVIPVFSMPSMLVHNACKKLTTAEFYKLGDF